MRIFAGVPWTGSVKQQWGNRKRGFSALLEYVFGILGNEANVITQYYLVTCRLSTDRKIRDLEWPFYVLFPIFTVRNRVSAIRLRRAIYRIFLLYDVTSKDVRKRTVKTAEHCGSAKGLRIFRIYEQLRALHRWNLNK